MGERSVENYGPAAGTQGFGAAPPPPPGTGAAQQPLFQQPPFHQPAAQPRPETGQQWQQLPPPPGGAGAPQGHSNPKRRKRLIIAGSVTAGLLVVLGVGGFFGYKYLGETTYSPRVQAEEYLQALVDGELERAMGLVPADDSLDNSLMTDEIYSKVTNRINGFEVTAVEVDGDTAEVTAEVRQGDVAESVNLRLSKAGTEAVLFNKWKLDAPLGTWSLRYLPDVVEASGHAVNGVEVKIPDDGRKFAVLPGDYTFNAPTGSKFVSFGDDEKMSVRLDSQESLMGVGFLPEITDAARDEIKAQTRAHLEACMKSTELLPKGCPNKADGEDPNNFRNIKWSMTREPTYAVIEGDPSTPFPVTAENGQFTLEAEMKQGDDWGMQKGTVELYSMPAKVNIQGETITMEFAE